MQERNRTEKQTGCMHNNPLLQGMGLFMCVTNYGRVFNQRSQKFSTIPRATTNACKFRHYPALAAFITLE